MWIYFLPDNYVPYLKTNLFLFFLLLLFTALQLLLYLRLCTNTIVRYISDQRRHY